MGTAGEKDRVITLVGTSPEVLKKGDKASGVQTSSAPQTDKANRPENSTVSVNIESLNGFTIEDLLKCIERKRATAVGNETAKETPAEVGKVDRNVLTNSLVSSAIVNNESPREIRTTATEVVEPAYPDKIAYPQNKLEDAVRMIVRSQSLGNGKQQLTVDEIRTRLLDELAIDPSNYDEDFTMLCQDAPSQLQRQQLDMAELMKEEAKKTKAKSEQRELEKKTNRMIRAAAATAPKLSKTTNQRKTVGIEALPLSSKNRQTSDKPNVRKSVEAKTDGKVIQGSQTKQNVVSAPTAGRQSPCTRVSTSEQLQWSAEARAVAKNPKIINMPLIVLDLSPAPQRVNDGTGFVEEFDTSDDELNSHPGQISQPYPTLMVESMISEGSGSLISADNLCGGGWVKPPPKDYRIPKRTGVDEGNILHSSAIVIAEVEGKGDGQPGPSSLEQGSRAAESRNKEKRNEPSGLVTNKQPSLVNVASGGAGRHKALKAANATARTKKKDGDQAGFKGDLSKENRKTNEIPKKETHKTSKSDASSATSDQTTLKTSESDDLSTTPDHSAGLELPTGVNATVDLVQNVTTQPSATATLHREPEIPNPESGMATVTNSNGRLDRMDINVRESTGAESTEVGSVETNLKTVESHRSTSAAFSIPTPSKATVMNTPVNGAPQEEPSPQRSQDSGSNPLASSEEISISTFKAMIDHIAVQIRVPRYNSWEVAKELRL